MSWKRTLWNYFWVGVGGGAFYVIYRLLESLPDMAKIILLRGGPE